MKKLAIFAVVVTLSGSVFANGLEDFLLLFVYYYSWCMPPFLV